MQHFKLGSCVLPRVHENAVENLASFATSNNKRYLRFLPTRVISKEISHVVDMAGYRNPAIINSFVLC